MAIGGKYNDGNYPDAGHVRVFNNILGEWVQVGVDIDGDNEDDNFGRSVSINSDGSIIAASSVLIIPGGPVGQTVYGPGYVRVFHSPDGYSLISTETDTIDFGQVDPFTEIIDSIKFYNTGTLDLEIIEITGTSNFLLSFEETDSFSEMLAGTVVPSLDSLTVYVRLYSETTQSLNELITISSDAANNLELDISVTANYFPSDVESLYKKEIVVYPNPVCDILYFHLKEKQIYQLKVFDFLGKEVIDKNISSLDNSINLSFLSNGMYFLSVYTDFGFYTEKIIKQ